MMGIPSVGILIQARNAAKGGVDAALNQLDRLRFGARGLKDMLFSVQGMFATLGLSIGAAGVGKFLLDTNRQFQSLLAQLKVLEGSAEGARAVFNQIEDFAAKTPFSIEDLTQAYIRLRTAGIQPTEEMMTSFGDLSSARSKSIIDFAMAVEDAVTGEMNRLKEFGIVAKQNGDTVTFTFNEQKTVVQNTASGIRDYLVEVGKSNVVQGSMAGQMTTLNGQISNMFDAIGTLARTIGEEGGFNEEIGNATSGIQSMTERALENASTVAAWAQLIIATTKGVVQSIIFPVRIAWNVITSLLDVVLITFNTFAWGVSGIGRVVLDTAAEMAEALGQDGLAKVLRDAADAQARGAEAFARSNATLWEGLGRDKDDVIDSVLDLGNTYLGVARAIGAVANAEKTLRANRRSWGSGGGGGGGGGNGQTDKELKNEIAALLQARELNALRAQDIRRADQLERQMVAALKDGNLALERRVQLEQNLRNIRQITGHVLRPQLHKDLTDPADRLKRDRFTGLAVLPNTRKVPVGQTPGLSSAILEAIGSAQTFEQVIADMITGTLTRFGDAISNAFASVVDGSESAAEAFKDAMLNSISAIAKGMGDWYMAQGVAAIAKGIGGNPAGWAEAAKWVAAGTAMYAVAGSMSGLASGGGGGGAGSSGSASRDTQRLAGAGRSDAVIVLEGSWQAFLSDPVAQDAFSNMLEDLSDRRVTVRYGG